MLKRISIRKICLTSAALFALVLIYLIPSNDSLKVKEELEYVDTDVISSPVFLMDKNSYVALTEAAVSTNDVEKKALELIKILTIGGMDSKVPSGFSAIIPPDTEVLNLTFDHDVLKVNFSKDLLDVSLENEEKMIEAIIYTLTSIEKVNKIIIYVEGDILTKLPKSKINLPSTLDRSFGINKEFNLTSTKDITDVTLYYINQINENYYYVPVTKYLNDNRDKISIIVSELSLGFNNKNLMSFMDDSVEFVSSDVSDDDIKLVFKEDMVNNVGVLNKTILLSVCDNYGVKSVTINEVSNMCKMSK